MTDLWLLWSILVDSSDPYIWDFLMPCLSRHIALSVWSSEMFPPIPRNLSPHSTFHCWNPFTLLETQDNSNPCTFLRRKFSLIFKPEQLRWRSIGLSVSAAGDHQFLLSIQPLYPPRNVRLQPTVFPFWGCILRFLLVLLKLGFLPSSLSFKCRGWAFPMLLCWVSISQRWGCLISQ